VFDAGDDFVHGDVTAPVDIEHRAVFEWRVTEGDVDALDQLVDGDVCGAVAVADTACTQDARARAGEQNKPRDYR